MSDTSAPAYRRILLKLSGEALRSPGSMDNISPEIVARIAEEIAQAHRAGVQIGLVVGLFVLGDAEHRDRKSVV